MGTVARYQEVRRTLATEIMSGRYSIGEKFPTDRELTQRFHVSRHTVREALRDLQARGILVRRRGSGTVVCGSSEPTLFVQEFSYLGTAFDIANDTCFERRSEGRLVVRPQLAERLHCKAGETWMRFAGVRWHKATRIRLAWTEIFVPEAYFGVGEYLSPATSTIYSVIQEKFGVTLHRLEQEITAVSLDPVSSAELQTPADSAGLSVLRRYFDSSGELFEVAASLYPADRFTFKTELVRSDTFLGGDTA